MTKASDSTTTRNAINIVMVGHTNTGKTSLMRTLLRDSRFGVVANSASTTRHVQSVDLQIDQQRLRLIDTPGLEDSMGLIDCIDSQAGELGIDRIYSFLQGEHPEFSQEIKVVKQLLNADILFYVIDSREPVLGRYQDELAILSYAAKPVLPILNFCQDPQLQNANWQRELAKRGLHAVINFDTVAYKFDSELQLYRAMQALLPAYANNFADIIASRERNWQQLAQQALANSAELLIDVAAFKVQSASDADKKIASAQQKICSREQRALLDQLNLYAFYQQLYELEPLAVAHGIWQRDLFAADTWLQLGLENSSAAAKGAAIGLGLDVISGGASLGMGTLLGAGLGVLYNNVNKIGDNIRGYQNYSADNNTLLALCLRQLALLQQLRRRGHASTNNIAIVLQQQLSCQQQLLKLLQRAKAHPNYSSMNQHRETDSDKREQLKQAIVQLLSNELYNLEHSNIE